MTKHNPFRYFRTNPEIIRLAQLIAAGKPPKLAIATVMRKLINLANMLIRDNRHWQASWA